MGPAITKGQGKEGYRPEVPAPSHHQEGLHPFSSHLQHSECSFSSQGKSKATSCREGIDLLLNDLRNINPRIFVLSDPIYI